MTKNEAVEVIESAIDPHAMDEFTAQALEIMELCMRDVEEPPKDTESMELIKIAVEKFAKELEFIKIGASDDIVCSYCEYDTETNPEDEVNDCPGCYINTCFCMEARLLETFLPKNIADELFEKREAEIRKMLKACAWDHKNSPIEGGMRVGDEYERKDRTRYIYLGHGAENPIFLNLTNHEAEEIRGIYSLWHLTSTGRHYNLQAIGFLLEKKSNLEEA